MSYETPAKKYQLVIRSANRVSGDTNDFEVQLGNFLPYDVQTFECRLMHCLFNGDTAGGITYGEGDPEAIRVNVIDIGCSINSAFGYDTAEVAPASVGFVINQAMTYRKYEHFTYDAGNPVSDAIYLERDLDIAKPFESYSMGGVWFATPNINNKRIRVVYRTMSGANTVENAPNSVLVFELAARPKGTNI